MLEGLKAKLGDFAGFMLRIGEYGSSVLIFSYSSLVELQPSRLILINPQYPQRDQDQELLHPSGHSLRIRLKTLQV